jgi:hypothetical protein
LSGLAAMLILNAHLSWGVTAGTYPLGRLPPDRYRW